MKFKIQFITFFSLFFIQMGCDLSKKRDTPPVESENSVFTYFLSEQIASDLPELTQATGMMMAVPMAAKRDSSFESRTTRSGTCSSLEEGISIPFSIVRFVDIGNINLSGYTLNNELSPFEKTSQNLFVRRGTLKPGSYTVIGAGIQDSLKVEQNFEVLPPSELLLIQSGSEGLIQQIPSPAIPKEEDENYEIVVDRSKDLFFGVRVPAGTQWIRITLKNWTQYTDGSIEAAHTLQCFHSGDFDPNDITLLAFRQQNLTGFDPNREGMLSIDFATNNLVSNMDRIQESYIESYTRQIHGMTVMQNSEGQSQAVQLGYLRFQ